MSLFVPKPRRAYLGSDSVWYCENSAGHCFLTSPESPVPEGFIRAQAQTVWEVERVWKRIDQQERRDAAQMSEDLYKRRLSKLTKMRSDLNQRIGQVGVTESEKDFIRASLRVLDRKEHTLQTNSIYGVAAMQEREAPITPSNTKVTTDG